MGGDGENGNGQKFLRKPQFSIEDIIKLAVFLGPWIMAGAVGIVAIKNYVRDARVTKHVALETKRTGESTYVLTAHLAKRADTLQAEIGRLATKKQVQRAIDQGNEVHDDQYRRIRVLERRSGMKPAPAHKAVSVFSWPRREQYNDVARGPTEDLWSRDPDGAEDPQAQTNGGE